MCVYVCLRVCMCVSVCVCVYDVCVCVCASAYMTLMSMCVCCETQKQTNTGTAYASLLHGMLKYYGDVGIVSAHLSHVKDYLLWLDVTAQSTGVANMYFEYGDWVVRTYGNSCFWKCLCWMCVYFQ